MKRSFFCIIIFLLVFILSMPAQADKNPVKEGQVIADLQFKAPYTEKERQYMGLMEEEMFTLEELDVDFFLIEVVGAYCPVCHAQSSEINHLFNRINRDEVLSEAMLMFSVSPGSTSMEIEYLRDTWKAPYPILEDYEYDFHAAIGSPDTPFTLIIRSDGLVLYAHLGRIPELSTFMEKIRNIVSQDG